jgi:Tol biopolymer transport system component
MGFKLYHILTIVILVVAVVIGGCIGSGDTQPGGPQEVEVRTPADLTQITFMEHASDPDWSPDGSQIIFEGREEGVETGLYLVNTDGTGLTRLGLGHNPSWSPVDNRVIYRGDDPDRSLFLVNLDGDWEDAVELASQINEHGSWSPDGERIAYGAPDGAIWIMNSDGSGKTRLTTAEDGSCMAPSFSHDGSKIAYLKGAVSYAVGASSETPNEIWTMNADGSNKQQVYAPGNSAQLLFQRAWNNNKITFMRTWYRSYYPQIWVVNSDGSDPELVVSAATDVFGDPVWDNTGTKVACSKSLSPSMHGNIWIFSYE